MRKTFHLLVASLLVVVLLLVGFPVLASSADYDILIINGTVVDGTGGTGYQADVGISNGKVVAIGDLATAEADTVIDATGLVVAPGFIDIHTHCDSGLVNPDLKANLNYLTQGVTTVICGNCGGSPLPIGEWFDTCDAQGIGTNALMLVGCGTIRRAGMGGTFDRPPTPQELDAMKSILAQAMKDGALGMSTGLEYPPGCYTTTEELIALAEVVAKYGGIYTSHMRDQDDGLVGAVAEVIRIAEEGGCPGEVSHFKVMGQANWGSTVPAIALIEEARARGVEVTSDQYPYTAASSGLSVTIPQWVHEGGTAALLQRLADPETRVIIRDEMIASPFGWWCGWDNIIVASLQVNTQYIGWSMQEVADDMAEDPYYAAFDLLIAEDGRVSCIYHFMCEEDVRTIMVQPWNMICSDGSVRTFGAGQPHPRNYGTFPRVLGMYVREEGVLTLEDAIRKMTSLPAQTVFLEDRGLIQEGFWADITVFNPDTVIDLATYENPHQYSEGIEYVLVNGEVTIEDGEYTGALAGKALRHLPPPSAGVGLTVDIPAEWIIAISAEPTEIDFGTLYAGQTSAPVTITIENIGERAVDVSALIDPAGTVFENLTLDDVAYGSWEIEGLAVEATGEADAVLEVPPTYTPKGEEEATLIFEATTP